MAAKVLANALRSKPQLGSQGPKVSLLTLGQCMPLLSSLPTALRFRDDLRCLTKANEIDWIDFSAPPDGCCFALVNPLSACGKVIASDKDRPKLLSPRFAEMFNTGNYTSLRGDRLRCHFQYLMASKIQGPYDYFAITAGSLTLAERFSSMPGVTD